MHNCIPSGVTPPQRKHPWLTKKLIQAMQRRDVIYKQGHVYTKYRCYRNKVVGLLRNAKMAYILQADLKIPVRHASYSTELENPPHSPLVDADYHAVPCAHEP